jgi:hypothetical protein
MISYGVRSAVLLLLLVGWAVAGALTEVPFEACEDVPNLLGISKFELSTKALKYGVVAGKITHTPTVDLDGPAFVAISIGPITVFKSFCTDCLFNPNGCPGPKGKENTVYPLIVNAELHALWMSLDEGTTVTVTVQGFVFDGAWMGNAAPGVTGLGCITFDVTKEADDSGPGSGPTASIRGNARALNTRRMDNEKRVFDHFLVHA